MVNFEFKMPKLGGKENVISQPLGGLIGGGANSSSGSGMDGGNNRAVNRNILRRAFGNETINVIFDETGFPIANIYVNGEIDYALNTALAEMRIDINPELGAYIWTLPTDISQSNISDLSSSINTFLRHTLDISNYQIELHSLKSYLYTSSNNIINPNFFNNEEFINKSIISLIQSPSAESINTLFVSDLSNIMNTYPTSRKCCNPINIKIYNTISFEDVSLTSFMVVPQKSIYFQKSNNVSGLTPFRRVISGGDPALSFNSAQMSFLRKAPNQVKVGNASISGWKQSAGGINVIKNSLNGNGPTLGSAWSGNPTYVYDSSNYIKFKKLQAINRNYNDYSFGGDRYFAAQQAYKRIH